MGGGSSYNYHYAMYFGSTAQLYDFAKCFVQNEMRFITMNLNVPTGLVIPCQL